MSAIEVPLAAVALGSNLAPRKQWLEVAMTALSACLDQASSLQRASLWATEPQNCPPGSGEFLNTVVCFPWPWGAEQLLCLTQSIEQSIGRQRLQVNAPRRIDLDLLFLGQESYQSQQLSLPHPRIEERLFVLDPLAELLPDWILPSGQTVHQAQQSLAKSTQASTRQPISA